MKKLSMLFKQLRLSRILTVFLATAVLFMGTAFNSVNQLGAHPNDTLVQVGGANNYKKLIASKEEGILYPGAESPAERLEVEKSFPIKTLKDFETAQPGGQIQREDDFGDRVQDRLSTVKETFDKASDFINEGAKEALDNHEAVSTPGLNK